MGVWISDMICRGVTKEDHSVTHRRVITKTFIQLQTQSFTIRIYRITENLPTFLFVVKKDSVWCFKKIIVSPKMRNFMHIRVVQKTWLRATFERPGNSTLLDVRKRYPTCIHTRIYQTICRRHQSLHLP